MKRTFSKKQISLHKEANIDQELGAIQSTQLTADNIIDKLLRPNNQDKKLTQDQKYRPKFEKRDYQALSKENMCLKIELKGERQAATQLKFKLSQAERKAKFLQGIQEKWQQSVQEDHDGKRLEVYTQILKKKIQELNELYLGSQQKIKELKKLPHISIFDQHTIQMEHLQRETVRLKAVIASFPHSSSQEDNLENKLLKLMKEENEKLKATIRLLQNDKNLLKSRQTIQKRYITDFKKEIQDLRRKLTIRQAELEKAQNETKNIQLQKAFQIQLDQEKRDNDEIGRLKGLLEQNRQEVQRVEAQKQQLTTQFLKLKKNEKMLENKQTLQDKEKSELRADNSHLRRIVEDMKNQLEREKENIRLLEQYSKKKKNEGRKTFVTPAKLQRISSVKFQELELPLMILAHCLQSGQLESLKQLIPEDEQLRCGRFLQILQEEPLCLERAEAIKLIRYVVETETSEHLGYNHKQVMNKDLSLTIIKASVNKLLECRVTSNEDIWRCLLAKARRLIPELQKRRGQDIGKGDLLEILARHIREPFGSYITLLLLESCNWEETEVEIILSVNKILENLNKMMMNQPLH